MKDQLKLFCGIEGGGTKTVVEIANESGHILGQVCGGSSNPWSLGSRDVDGFMLAARVFSDLIRKALKQIESNLNRSDLSLTSLAICYSGGGSEVADRRLNDAMRNEGFVDCQIHLGNDCLAPIFTAFKNGGIVLISGTGSNCILVNPIDETKQVDSMREIKSYNSGGWGNLLGDEGSAYWVAQKAIKYLIDVNDNFHNDSDNLVDISCELDQLQGLVFEHFQIKSLSDLLPYFYADFKKDFIAGLTMKLAQAAATNQLFREFFEEAGYQLGKHIVAISPKIDEELLNKADGLPIICTGSVYKSWDLLKPGFMKCLRDNWNKCSKLRRINLVRVEGHSATGAVLLAARLYDRELEFVKKFNYDVTSSRLDQISIDSTMKLHDVSDNGSDKLHVQKVLSLNFFTSYIKGIWW